MVAFGRKVGDVCEAEATEDAELETEMNALVAEMNALVVLSQGFTLCWERCRPFRAQSFFIVLAVGGFFLFLRKIFRFVYMLNFVIFGF